MDVIVESIPDQDNVKQPTTRAATGVEHMAIAERFNITTPTKEESEKLSSIWSYVKQQGEERSIPDIVWDVISLEQKIGSPKIGESRLDKLYRYVNLRVQEARIQEELRNVSGSHNLLR